ncbi:MAG: type II toxin-antitoxin system VapC family toxin [Terriglobales bacterium]
MSSEFEKSLRRLKPEKRGHQLRLRAEAELIFFDLHGARPRSLVYDTTVYIDILQGRFPEGGEPLLLAADAWHSTVAENELASTCALLDPTHPNTPAVIKQIAAIVEKISPYRSLAPDREIWRDAGLLTGTIARLQGTPKSERHRVMNDALIFATARKHGYSVLTRNISDFDSLHQLDPSGRVVFYRV